MTQSQITIYLITNAGACGAERGRVAVTVGMCESANVEGIELWVERKSRDVLTVSALVVLDRRRNRNDTHVIVLERRKNVSLKEMVTVKFEVDTKHCGTGPGPGRLAGYKPMFL
jgi:hypothetical protein